jgi:hypothetical protein
MKDLKAQKQIINILLVIFLLIGCRVSTPAPSPSAAPTGSTIESFTPTPMLLSPETITSTEIPPAQDIASPFPELSPDDYGSLIYEKTFDENDGMRLLLAHKELFPSHNPEYSDFIFETEFHQMTPMATDFAVIYVKMRFAISPCSGFTGNSSYLIAVTGMGRVIAARYECGNRQPLAETYALHLPNSIRRLTIIAKGDEFRIFLNGNFEVSFSDPTLKSGSWVIGNDGPDILFLDSIRIYSVED